MPRQSKIPELQKQVETLTKDLGLARGSLKDRNARIEDLEKRLAAKTEELQTIHEGHAELDALKKKYVELLERIDAADNINRAWGIRVEELTRQVKDREDRLTKLRAIAINEVRVSKALGAALKAVL